MKTLLCAILIALVSSLAQGPPALAQPLGVSIESFDASRLPRMKMEAAVRWNGMQLQSTQGLSLSGIENGQSVDADIWCPDTATGTAVALVLDNSGTISGVASIIRSKWTWECRR